MDQDQNFTDCDFELFSNADENACEACLYGYCNNEKVSEPQAFQYRRQLENTFTAKFEFLKRHVLAFLQNEFAITLTYRFEPISRSLYKVRPLCYAIFSRDYVGGQITAQLNFRLSYDKRPGDNLRTKKFGVKFSLHDKCSEKLRNEDLGNFRENILNPQMYERVIHYIQRLGDEFTIYRNLGYGHGVDGERILKGIDIKSQEDLERKFLYKRNDAIYFQEIFRAYRWDVPKQKQIIQDMNKLAMTVIRDFLFLYPFYLFAVIRGEELLETKLNEFDALFERKKEMLRCSAIELLEQPEPYIVNAGDSDDKFEEIFRKYIEDADYIEIEEPWMFQPKQRNNLLRVLKLVANPRKCNVLLITKNKGQEKFLKETKQKIERLGISFKYTLSKQDIHDRLIKTNYWTIHLGKGLDMFKGGKAVYKHEIAYTRKVPYKLK